MSTIINLKIDHTRIDSTLTDFPVMINLAAYPQVFTAITADADRKKLSVKIADESQCYVEIEFFDYANSKGVLWTKVPSVSSSEDTELILEVGLAADNDSYVGDAGDAVAQNVWNSNVKGAWGFGQDPSGGASCILDSTSNTNHGTPTGCTASADLVDADFGKGLNIDALTDKVELDSTYALTGEFEFEALLNIRTFGDENALFGNSSYNDGRLSFIESNQMHLTRSGNVNTGMPVALSPSFPEDEFALLSVSRDSSNNFKVYSNGVEIGSETGISGTVDFQRLFKGPDNSGWEDLQDAIVSEVRLYDSPLTSAYRKANYYTMTDSLISANVAAISASLEASFPALTCLMGTSIKIEFPAIICEMGSGGFLDCSIPPLSAILEANKFSFSGDLIDSLGALTMTGVTDQYRYIEASMAALTAGLQATANFVRLTPSFPRLNVVLGTGAYVNAEIPKLQSALSGQNGIIASLSGSLKALTEQSYTGGICITELPMLNCTLTGTTLAVCSISMSLPKLNSVIVAKFNSPIDMTFNLPKLKSSIVAFNTAPGSLSFSLPIINMDADGVSGVLASLEANIPFFRQTRISASQPDINNLISQMPMLSSSFNIENIPESVLRYMRGQLR